MSSRRPIYLNPAAAAERCDHPSSTGATEFHKSLPNYAPTPLVSLPELATELGVKAVFVKDESNRFGLPSFKVLGASWGCFRAIAQTLGLESDKVTLDELSLKAKANSISLVTASEGNHGRAVAYMARLLGIQAEIFVPRSMTEETKNRIASEGARVSVVQGTYDQAVKSAYEKGFGEHVLLVQDTAFEGYEDVPAWIVEGYSTMLEETEEQLSQLGLSASMMVTPVGVGSLAHAVAKHCKSRQMTMVAVEPDSAPCLSSSLHAGKSIAVETSATIMDGMNCGTVSTTAWPNLQRLVDACVTVSSYESHRAVQYLTSNSVHAGPCGGASLAAVQRLAQEASSLLNEQSVVVLLSTEGARPYPIPKDVSVEDAVSLTQVLTQIDSSNPTLSVSGGAGESEIADYLSAWFAHRDIEFHRIEPVSGRPSVVGVLRGSGGGKSLMFNGHVDTVSNSSYEQGVDPLSGAIGMKNGEQAIFGRGCLDMKGGVAASLAALAAIKAKGPDHLPRGDIIIAAVSDEEDASQGTQDLIAAGWRADAAVIPEPTMEVIVTAHKGFVWVEVDILGVAAHGSMPSLGQDSIIHAGWFLQALEEHQLQLPEDDLLGQASLHCGLIRGGEEPSSYPGKCTITVEFRTIPAQSEESILEDVRVLLRSVSEKKPQFQYDEPRITMSRPTTKLSRDHPLVQKAVACSTPILGRAPSLGIVPFWCDAALLAEVGIPSIVFGPAGEGLHSKEEWVKVASLRHMEEIFINLAQDFCS
ncbi:Peptidase M20 [Penicillium verhagenii]|uniref:Peptidase M20 n=1 Tax=Penicillium verhagenii TaxID=1562060 RepID=UPI0025452FE4|nr:Peptidase M20 [Penicillium verhagenii]KAJ5928592.1 Peptidase M20 [Penicillium verhagenii]